MLGHLAHHLPILLILLPGVLALIIFMAGLHRTATLLYVAGSLIGAALVLLGHELVENGPLTYHLGGWHPPLGITLRVDGLAFLFLLVTAVVVLIVGGYARAYFAGDRQNHGHRNVFWPLLLMLWMALNALFMSNDVFNLYVTLELLTLASVGMIVLSGTADATGAALRYLVLGLAGSLLYLAGLALLYGAHGVLDLQLLSRVFSMDTVGQVALVLMVIGLAVKTALFPIHTWLPPAHGGAPAPVSALLSGLVVKGSFFILVRLWSQLVTGAGTPLAYTLSILGGCAVLWGGLQALRAERLKMLVAYSTVAHIGYLFMWFPLACSSTERERAWIGMGLLAISHALAKSALFLAAGSVQHTVGHDRLEDLGGLGARMALAMSATALAGVSLMGLPPSGGFAGKWMLLTSAIPANQPWIIVMLLGGGLLTAGYLFRFWRVAYRQEVAVPVSAKPCLGLDLPAFILAVAALLVGALSSLIARLLVVGAPSTSLALTGSG
jgi:formate hydrogenlyase subunit 3/multisubunit Na+/H+ antiporter MnhD subunit